MILRWLTLALFALGFAPGLLHAQQEPIIHPKLTRVDMRGQRAVNIDKMYEDIEIMRRILDGKLDSLYPSAMRQGNSTRNQWYFEPSTYEAEVTVPGEVKKNNTFRVVPETRFVQTIDGVPFKALEGVYLKGHGVVYTATLPSLEPPAKAGAHSTAARLTWTIAHSESEWDNIRRQVRNEKEEPKKSEAIKPPSLSDVVLKVLAENGHHFSQLGENESLTIVLTVHEPRPSPPATKSRTGSASAESKQANNGSGPDLRAQLRDLELLGELHLKQGKYDEAIKTFHKAMGQTENEKRQAELLRKLAQCHLMQGQDEKARNELDKAIIILKQETKAEEKPAPAPKPAAELPVKLIISAPKKLLDQAKEGKITFEEFRRQASVETLRFGDHR